MAHPVDLFVDLGFFFDEGVGPRDVGFGLVVVVEGNKIFDGVVREKPFEFAVKLGGEGFVWCKDNRWALRFLDHFRHGECFAGSRGPKQDLIAFAVAQPL